MKEYKEEGITKEEFYKRKEEEQELCSNLY